MLDVLLVAEALPDDTPETRFSSLGVAALLAGSCVIWFWALARWRRGEPAIAAAPRRSVPWRAAEVIAVIGFLMASTIGGALFSPEEAEPLTLDDLARTFLIGSAFNVAFVAAVGAFLAIVRQADGHDLGILPRLPDDLAIGGLGWLAALVPVYALQAALVYLVADDRQAHPLIEMLTETRRADVLFLAVVSAVVVAPMVEEFFFRVLLQGWLEKRLLPAPGDSANEVLAAPQGELVNATEAAESFPMDEPSLPPTAGIETPFDAYRSPEADLNVEQADASLSATDVRGWRGFLPIGISAFLFAAAHAGTWPDPVPLFVLALVLGYVYRQTHRLWPSVVLHMLFNGLSLAVVWFSAE